MRARVVARLVTAVLVLVGCLTAVTVVAPSRASATTPDVLATTKSTTTCSSGVIWHVAARLFSERASVASIDATKQLLDETGAMQSFADEVGTDSDCAARASVDLYQANEPYVADHSNIPVDDPAFRAGHLVGGTSAYDVVMYVIPEDPSSAFENSICGSEFDVGHSGVIATEFPSGPNHSGCAVGGGAPTGPWSLLILHEFLHGLVNWADDRVVWPTQDVHGACYVTGYACSGVNETYFHDLMTGKVTDNDGVKKGITAEQWQSIGTPSSIVILALSAVARTGVSGTTSDEVGRALPDLPVTLRTYAGTPGIPRPDDPVVASGTTDADGKVFFPLPTTDPVGNRYITYYLAFAGNVAHPRHEASNSVAWFVDPPRSSTGFPFPTPSGFPSPTPSAVPGAHALSCTVRTTLVRPAHAAPGVRSLRSTITCTRRTGQVALTVQRRAGGRWKTVATRGVQLATVVKVATTIHGSAQSHWRVQVRSGQTVVGTSNVVTIH